jgi:G3E family GTPase
MIDTSTLIPVHILTGALGSGKTTLLNEALRAGLGAETAVIVNEFGEVALDPHFIQTRSEDTVVLQSGCVCCSIRSDLVSTLMQLVASRPTSTPLHRVLIETSGVSDPVPILYTLRSDPRLSVRFRIGTVICAIAALDDDLGERAETLRQIASADVIVMTKCDLVDPAVVASVQARARGLNPLAQFLAQTGAVLVRWLEQCEARREGSLRWLELPPATDHHAHGLHSGIIRAEAPPSWPHFAVWLTRLVFLHGDRILRTKGVLFDPQRNVWIGVHGVKRFIHSPMHLELTRPPAWGACLVFITEGLDPLRLERSYERLSAGSGERKTILDDNDAVQRR